MNALIEQLTDNEKQPFTKNGLFNICLYMDYQRYLQQEWELSREPLPYEEITDARYIEYGHFTRNDL